jgi:hypothetical protein
VVARNRTRASISITNWEIAGPLCTPVAAATKTTLRTWAPASTIAASSHGTVPPSPRRPPLLWFHQWLQYPLVKMSRVLIIAHLARQKGTPHFHEHSTLAPSLLLLCENNANTLCAIYFTFALMGYCLKCYQQLGSFNLKIKFCGLRPPHFVLHNLKFYENSTQLSSNNVNQ